MITDYFDSKVNTVPFSIDDYQKLVLLTAEWHVENKRGEQVRIIATDRVPPKNIKYHRPVVALIARDGREDLHCYQPNGYALDTTDTTDLDLVIVRNPPVSLGFAVVFKSGRNDEYIKLLPTREDAEVFNFGQNPYWKKLSITEIFQNQ